MNVSNSWKSKLTCDPPPFIKAARFRALSIAPYLAAMIGRMPIIETPGLGTMATDRRARVYIDMQWAATKPVEELAAILAHEAWHVLRKHMLRTPQYFTPLRLAELYALGWSVEMLQKAGNIAWDMEINDGLADDFERDGKKPLQDGKFPKQIEMEDGLLGEQYLTKILEQELQPPPPSPGGGGGGGGKNGKKPTPGTVDINEGHPGGSSTGGDLREWELDDDGNAEDDAGEEVPGLSQGEQEIARRQVAEDIINHMRQAGSVSAGLDLWAKVQLAKPEVPWEQLLRSCLRNGIAMAKGKDEESFAMMNKKSIGLRRVFKRAPVLPGLVSIEPSIAFVLDTSGSMGGLHEGSPLWSAVSEVLAVCKEQEVAPWVTCVDTEGVEPVQVKTAKELQRILKGGGGTDMAEGLRLITAAGLRPDFIAIVTDGYTPWPTNSGIPKRARLGIVITPGGCEQLEDVPSRAQVIRMKKKPS